MRNSKSTRKGGVNIEKNPTGTTSERVLPDQVITLDGYFSIEDIRGEPRFGDCDQMWVGGERQLSKLLHLILDAKTVGGETY